MTIRPWRWALAASTLLGVAPAGLVAQPPALEEPAPQPTNPEIQRRSPYAPVSGPVGSPRPQPEAQPPAQDEPTPQPANAEVQSPAPVIPAGGTEADPAQAATSQPEAPAPRMLPQAAPATPPLAQAGACPPANVVPAKPWPLASSQRRSPSFLQRCKGRLQACFLGYPEEFEAPPPGYQIAQHFKTEVANGEAARMVLHDYDFVADGGQLNVRGKERLAQIAALLPRNFFPVVVEQTPRSPGLAEARRVAVLNELTAGSFPVPPERVLIGPSLANGLRGVEAEFVYRNQILNTIQKGPSVATGGVGSQGGGGGQFGGGGAGTGSGQ